MGSLIMASLDPDPKVASARKVASRSKSLQKGLPGGSARLIRAALFFEKPGRPAGQPTMYLDPPIHFGGIFIGIGILWVVLPYYGWYFPYYGWYFLYYGWYYQVFLLRKHVASSPAGRLDGSGAALFFLNLAGRLASQPCIWIHPSILGVFVLELVYYWMYFPYHEGYFPY